MLRPNPLHHLRPDRCASIPPAAGVGPPVGFVPPECVGFDPPQRSHAKPEPPNRSPEKVCGTVGFVWRRAARRSSLVWIGLLGFVWAIGLGSAAPGQTPTSYTAQAAPLLAKYCGACHNPGRTQGGVDVSRFGVDAAFVIDGKTGRKILENVEGGSMPPDDAPQPTPAELAKLVAELQSVVAKAGCALNADPGRVTLRRLNRVEYNNTIRDLIGVDCRPADDFPSDDVGYGFDNIGDVLSLPPMLMERYLAAAEAVSRPCHPRRRSPARPVPSLGPAAYGQARGERQLRRR